MECEFESSAGTFAYWQRLEMRVKKVSPIRWLLILYSGVHDGPNAMRPLSAPGKRGPFYLLGWCDLLCVDLCVQCSHLWLRRVWDPVKGFSKKLGSVGNICHQQCFWAC